MGQSETAWADYWEEAAAPGCAPRSSGIAAITRTLWIDFAARLSPGAAVLDLATGNGAVLLHIAAVRPGASLVGVDSAPTLGRSSSRGLDLRPAIAMEAVPFADGAFEAVTSQFGFEYGDTAQIALEIARLLGSGGKLRLLVHHTDSPVVEQGRARRAALAWAIGPQSPLGKAERFAEAPVVAGPVLPAELTEAPALGAALFPGQNAAREIMTAMVQIVGTCGTNAPALLLRLRHKVTAEAARLDALLAAARSANQIAAISQELSAAGLRLEQAIEVRERDGAPAFAWLLDGRRD